MIPPILVAASVIAVTGLVALASRVFPWRVCAICAGVSLTWVGLLVLPATGVPVDPALPAVLMGGSVVGIAYVLERRLPAGRSALAWKATFIPLGFLAAHALLTSPLAAPPLAIAAALVAWGFLRPPAPGHGAEARIAAELRDCC